MIMRWLAVAACLLICGPAVAQVDLRRGNVAETESLDPQKSFSDYDAEIIRDLFHGILSIDAKANPIPGLAESWTVSPDGLIYTFKFRKGLMWSDGVPLTADDALFAFQRALDPAVKAAYVNQIYPIKNAEAIYKGQLKIDQLGVKVLAPDILQITLYRPAPTILLALANQVMTYPVPRHLITKTPNGWSRPGVMVSSGAYTLAAWRVADHLRLDKNPRFFDAANVAIDRVFFYPTIDDSAALIRYRAGELDLNTRFPPNQLAWLKQNIPAEVRVTPALWTTYLVPNIRRPAFKDVRVRRALSMVIDREVLTDKVLRNGEKPFWGVVPDTIPDYVSPAKRDPRPLADRQAEARQLLAAAGYGPNKPLKFTFNHRAGLHNRLTAVTVANMWKQIGVQVELFQLDVALHYNKLRIGDFDMADAGYSDNADPEFFTILLETEGKEVNYGGYSNPDYDRRCKAARVIQDRAARFKAFAEAESVAIADAGKIPLYLSVERALVKPYVKGFVPNPLGQYPTRFLRIEGRK